MARHVQTLQLHPARHRQLAALAAARDASIVETVETLISDAARGAGIRLDGWHAEAVGSDMVAWWIADIPVLMRPAHARNVAEALDEIAAGQKHRLVPREDVDVVAIKRVRAGAHLSYVNREDNRVANRGLTFALAREVAALLRDAADKADAMTE